MSLGDLYPVFLAILFKYLLVLWPKILPLKLQRNLFLSDFIQGLCKLSVGVRNPLSPLDDTLFNHSK
jgi:hypothetical protein